MDAVKLGRVVRALRIRRAWRQLDLANAAKVSQSLIARVERGGAARLTVRTLEAIATALGALLVVRVDWNGEAADRLLDLDHAALVERVVAMLRSHGWEAVPEVTFAFDRERGSIDVLAWHATTATVLVIEVKSVVPDMQSMLAAFDRKIRLADRIARERGWRPGRIACLLVLGESRTARRRVEQHAATFEARLPHRSAVVRRFLARPGEVSALRGLMFVPFRTGTGSRQRVVRPREGTRARAGPSTSPGSTEATV